LYRFSKFKRLQVVDYRLCRIENKTTLSAFVKLVWRIHLCEQSRLNRTLLSNEHFLSTYERPASSRATACSPPVFHLRLPPPGQHRWLVPFAIFPPDRWKSAIRDRHDGDTIRSTVTRPLAGARSRGRIYGAIRCSSRNQMRNLPLIHVGRLIQASYKSSY